MTREPSKPVAPPKYIAIDGPIGAGKTTLMKRLAEDLGGRPIFEPVEQNPFLPDFYKDRKRYAFKTQLFFLLNRYQQQQELMQRDLFSETTLCDYTFAKDWIFSRINLTADEQELYDKVYGLLDARLPKPDIVVYLKADPDVLMKRIKTRGVDYEKPISSDYLKTLTNAFNQYFLNYTDSPLLVVDTTDLDFVQHNDEYELLKKDILQHRQGTKHLILRS